MNRYILVPLAIVPSKKWHNQVHCLKFCQLKGFPFTTGLHSCLEEDPKCHGCPVRWCLYVMKDPLQTRPEFSLAQSTNHRELRRKPQEHTEKEKEMKRERGYVRLSHFLRHFLVSSGLVLSSLITQISLPFENTVLLSTSSFTAW